MAKPPIYARPRYVRQRVYQRLRHGVNSLLKVFVNAEGARLAGTASTRTFTANTNDILSATGHGFVTGKGPVLVESSGTLPAPLAENTPYWPIRINDDTFYLATSRENAAAGVRVDIADTGSGTHTAEYASDGPAMLERLRQGVKPDQLRAANDIDDL